MFVCARISAQKIANYDLAIFRLIFGEGEIKITYCVNELANCITYAKDLGRRRTTKNS